MLTLLGWSLIGGSFIASSYPAFESVFLKDKYNKRKVAENLHKAFYNANLYKKYEKKNVFPQVIRIDQRSQRLTIVFSVPRGINPEEFEKRMYVFKQHFGQYATLDMTEARGVLSVYPKGLPNEYTYKFNKINKSIDKVRLPIVCGLNLDGNMQVFDMIKYPHILISGETGSGKSSQLRSILTTLIKSKSPKELRLILGDLKRSEFHLFKQIEHVEGVYHSADELLPSLKRVKKEMARRGDKLDEEEVNSIDELKKKLPYIVVCVDEVALLKKEKDVMDILEDISSVGRSLGVFVVLSMQRPDSQLLDGKLKVNLTVRMGFKTADSINSNIIGTPGSEKITVPGRMLMRINSDLEEIQCPWLDNDKAKRLLDSYKVKQSNTPKQVEQKDDYSQLKELLNK